MSNGRGKKVPERNIMGNVMMSPPTPADSTLFVTVPTSIPRETKNRGPIIRKGITAALIETCAEKKSLPNKVIKKNEMMERTTYQITLEVSHSPFVSGVKDSCLKNFDFLYSEEMLTMENIGLVRIEKPTRPGIRKSM